MTGEKLIKASYNITSRVAEDLNDLGQYARSKAVALSESVAVLADLVRMMKKHGPFTVHFDDGTVCKWASPILSAVEREVEKKSRH